MSSFSSTPAIPTLVHTRTAIFGGISLLTHISLTFMPEFMCHKHTFLHLHAHNYNLRTLTGSDGMGKATAKSCLLSGGRVVLVSRTASKLEAAKTELITETGVDPSFVEIEACDCTSVDAVKEFFDKRSPGKCI